MIPFGPFRPDAAGINTPAVREARNVLPSPIGFKALPAPVAVTNALQDDCIGAAVVLQDDGATRPFAGDAQKLYLLTAATWADVSKAGSVITAEDASNITDEAGATITSEGFYATPAGERWRFELFGAYVLATNYLDPVQYYELGVSSQFADLPGNPPEARYIAIIRDFVVLGGVNGYETRIQWSGLNDAEIWTPGTASSDFQDMPTGGPITGLLGGATGYVFQKARVTRMTYVPGSEAVFQFDEVQGGKGLVAPNSLVKLGDEAYYLASDGFYRMDLNSGGQTPIGVNKWRTFFMSDYRAGTEGNILGAADPINPIILWAYISRDNSGTTPDRLLIYDRVLDEATFANINVEALAAWTTSDVTLDTMNDFGSMETLPYSLDSPFWKAGASVIGVFGTDNRLAFLQGANLEARIITADGQSPARAFIRATRPAVDSTQVTVAIAARERDGDAVTFGADEVMEDTGEVSAHASGFLARARIIIPTGATWSLLKGIETNVKQRGRR